MAWVLIEIQWQFFLWPMFHENSMGGGEANH
jgi:hypothetical protein